MAADDDDAWMGSPSKRDPAWRILGEVPRFELAREDEPDADDRLELYRRWRALPPYPFVLDEIGTGAACRIRFAAIDWTAPKRPFVDLAVLGVQLVRVFEFLVACEGLDELGWFTCPFVKLDLTGAPRVGFWPPSGGIERVKRVAPEVIATWPRVSESALVYAVGQLLMDLVVVTREDLASQLGALLRQCVHTDAAKRPARLKRLRQAFQVRPDAVPRGDESKVWPAVELGIGHLVAGEPTEALAVFEAADKFKSKFESTIRAGRRRALARGAKLPALPTIIVEPYRVPTHRTWPDIAAAGARLEANLDPRAAIALYLAIPVFDEYRVPHTLALARTHLAAGDYGHAIDYASRLTPSRESLAIVAKGWIAKREAAKALAVIDRWDALAPGEAAPAYQRGKALLLLSRLPEARAAFDTALARDGKMIEAMLLRREVDRHMGRHREIVGAQQQASVDPALLALVGAEPAEAIAALGADRFAGDPYAQLMLAELLVGEQRYGDAIASYDRAIAELPQARKGKAMALLELGRPQEALAALGDAKDMAATELRAWIQSKIVKS